jgi:hypothetical protein
VTSKSLVKWLKILWENWRVSVRCRVSFFVSCCVVSFCLALSPAAGEFVFLL